VTYREIIIYNPTNYNLVDEVTFHVQDLKTGLSRNSTINLKGSTVYVTEYEVERDNYNSQVAIDNLYRDEASREFVSGDFNNDGLVDFLIFEPQGLNRPNKIYFVEIGKNEMANLTPIVLNEGLSLKGLDYYVIEFNGDGVPEIMAVNKQNSNYWIYKIDLKTIVLQALPQEL
jgi:hypothetical protein